MDKQYGGDDILQLYLKKRKTHFKAINLQEALRSKLAAKVRRTKLKLVGGTDVANKK